VERNFERVVWFSSVEGQSPHPWARAGAACDVSCVVALLWAFGRLWAHRGSSLFYLPSVYELVIECFAGGSEGYSWAKTVLLTIPESRVFCPWKEKSWLVGSAITL
jgi:hypothetical protein